MPLTDISSSPSKVQVTKMLLLVPTGCSSRFARRRIQRQVEATVFSLPSPNRRFRRWRQGFRFQPHLLGLGHLRRPHLRPYQPPVQEAASKVAQALKNVAGGLKSETIQAAVAKAKFERATILENRTASHELVSAQLLESGKVATLEKPRSSRGRQG